MEYMNGLGFISDVTTGSPVPSSMFDISAVSINEQFSPLIGIDVTLLNNMTAKLEYKKSRVMNLSMSSVQLVETNSDDTFSRMLTLNAYYDHQTNIPVVSASSYPTSTHDFGVSLKFSLTR